MKKRNVIIFAISLVLTAVSMATNTLFLTLFVFLVVFVCLKLALTILEIKLANKYYKDLLENIKYIDFFEHERYCAYFTFAGKELEETISDYDMYLQDCYNLSELLLDYLKDLSKYLSKEKYNKVLEIKKNGIRKTSRA